VPAGFEVLEFDHAGRFRFNPGIVVERIDWSCSRGTRTRLSGRWLDAGISS
jgi:hypothetical protein